MILLPYKKIRAQKCCAVFNSGDHTSLHAEKKAREKQSGAQEPSGLCRSVG